jgi:hypothetical protein
VYLRFRPLLCIKGSKFQKRKDPLPELKVTKGHITTLLLGQRKVTFWTLKTFASEDFDPKRLTERQQMAYFAAQSHAVDNPLRASPFRLDRLLADSTVEPTVKYKKHMATAEGDSEPTARKALGPVPEEMLVMEGHDLLDLGSGLDNAHLAAALVESPNLQPNSCCPSSELEPCGSLNNASPIFHELQKYIAGLGEIDRAKRQIAISDRERRISISSKTMYWM